MESPAPKAVTRPCRDLVIEVARTTWWVGLGAAALAAEGAARWFRACAEKGKLVEPELCEPLAKLREKARAVADQLRGRLRTVAEKSAAKPAEWEARLEQKLTGVLERVTQPLRDELRELEQRLERLEQKLGPTGTAS